MIAGKSMKLSVPTSKNKPVRSVPKMVKTFNETSSYCKVINITLTSSDIRRNHNAKENKSENRLGSQLNLDILLKCFVQNYS